MKNKWLLLTLLCIFTGMFYSCSTHDQKKKGIIIAVIPKVDNAIFDQVKKSAFQAGKDLGITVTWEAPTSNDGAKQKELIENLIHYKVNGILISCNDVEMLREPINEAIKAGIKVGTFDSDCPTSNRTFYIGTDNRKAGRVCAETMASLFQKAHKVPNKIVILSGGANAENMMERLAGFRSVYGQSKIDQVLFSFEMPNYGEELLSMRLKKNKEINGIEMLWGVPALNGVDSVPALSKFMKKGGIAVFFDVSKPLLRYIKDHPNCATMKQDFKAMGYDGVMNLYNAIEGKSYRERIVFNVKVIDHSNAAKELKKL